LGMSQAMNCLATVILSLRDGRLFGHVPGNELPGYGHPVPAGRVASLGMSQAAWLRSFCPSGTGRLFGHIPGNELPGYGHSVPPGRTFLRYLRSLFVKYLFVGTAGLLVKAGPDWLTNSELAELGLESFAFWRATH